MLYPSTPGQGGVDGNLPIDPYFVRYFDKVPHCGAHGAEWQIVPGTASILHLALPAGLPFCGWLQVMGPGSLGLKFAHPRLRQ